MGPTDFEKWCAGELGYTPEFIMSKRRSDFFGTTGYKLSEIEVRYRAWNAGVRSRLPYQTQPPEGMEKNGIQLDVLWLGQDEIYVYFIQCGETLATLQDIETQLLKDADEYEMFTEHGTYQISVTRDHGEFDSCGRCEIAPYWDFDIQSFDPMPEE